MYIELSFSELVVYTSHLINVLGQGIEHLIIKILSFVKKIINFRYILLCIIINIILSDNRPIHVNHIVKFVSFLLDVFITWLSKQQ